MCLSIPAKVESIEGDMALVSVGGATYNASLQLLDDVKPGDFILLHTGFAIQKISQEEAEETLRLFDEFEELNKEMDKEEKDFREGKQAMIKYIDEYRDKEIVLNLARKIKNCSTKSMSFMEVCGGHTMAIQKFGIPTLLPENIKLLSGPGCPVCVTSRSFIDHAISLARLPEVIITTYGDLIRVPGSTSSLNKERSTGSDVRIVYSILDALEIAKNNPDKKTVFLGIGFETTTPSSAAGILNAKRDGIHNFFLLSSHKVMPPAMEALIDDGVKIDGYIAPGHVSTITGTGIYRDIPVKYGLGCVISGFEPVDLMQSILMLAEQIENKNPKVEIQYKRAVFPEGNKKAQKIMAEVFEPCDSWWRGLGILKDSGLKLRKEFKDFDAGLCIPVKIEETKEDKGCICGEILKGLKKPEDCKLFGKACTPSDPVGACMVSNEGACAAHYKYRINNQ